MPLFNLQTGKLILLDPVFIVISRTQLLLPTIFSIADQLHSLSLTQHSTHSNHGQPAHGEQQSAVRCDFPRTLVSSHCVSVAGAAE